MPDASPGLRPAASDALPAFGLARLRLTDFRNHAFLDLDLDPRPVVVAGPNGAGKTNVLEALSLLTPGRGLRQARLADMARQGGPGRFGIHARLRAPAGALEIGTGIEADAPERRVVRVDGTPQASANVLGRHVRALWLTPMMDRLFTDPASTRRRFIDRLTLAVDPDHAGHGGRYDRAMRERNRLLRQAATEGRPVDAAWAQALERQMAEAGTALAAGRRLMLERLAAGLAAAPDGPFPRPGLALEGMIETWLETMPAVEVEDRLAAHLARQRVRDTEAGRALDGPHTSDLKVWHAGKMQAADLCSTGEQKALLIAILLAHARGIIGEGHGLLLLLDEVAAHLDAGRRAALFAAILDLGVQAWMTGTDPILFETLGDRAQTLTFAPRPDAARAIA